MQSQCKPNPSLFARSRFASRAPSTCRTCILACDGVTGCFSAIDSDANDAIDGVYSGGAYIGAPGPVSSTPGTPGGATAFDAYAYWYPGKLLNIQVGAQSGK